MTEKLEEKPDVKKPEEEEEEEEEDHDQLILKAINEKYKDDLTTKLKLLALFRYSQIESENSENMNKEADALNNKFQKLTVPLVNKSNEVINGKKLDDQDLHNHHQYLAEGEEDKKGEIISKDQKPIEVTTYGHLFDVIILYKEEEIKAHDEEPLKALRSIEYFPSEKLESPHNFTLKFHFAPNDYFENDVLIKEFEMEDEREAKKTECTIVKWKEGKDVTKKSTKKKQKNKKTGQSRTVTKLVDQESFFTFFRNMENKEDDEKEDDEEDEAEELDHIDRHVDIGQTIVEEILPYSSEYYLGVRKMPDFGFLKDQLGAGGEEGGDDDDGADDDGDDGGKKSKKKKGGKPEAAGAGGEKQECKQQ